MAWRYGFHIKEEDDKSLCLFNETSRPGVRPVSFASNGIPSVPYYRVAETVTVRWGGLSIIKDHGLFAEKLSKSNLKKSTGVFKRTDGFWSGAVPSLKHSRIASFAWLI